MGGHEMKTIAAVFSAGVLFLASPSLAWAEEGAKSSLYVVDTYDPNRNPDDDVKTAVSRAKSEGKHILVQVGGDWCGWCHLMNKYFKENDKVAAALAKDFLI